MTPADSWSKLPEMKKPTLTEFAQIAEVMAAVAVVVSLLYVAQQVQENTSQIEAASLESGADFIRAINDLMATDESAALVLKGLNDFGELTPIEKARFDSLIANVTTYFAIARDLYLDGFLAEHEYRNYEEMLARILLSPGANEWHVITKTHIRLTWKRFSTISLNVTRNFNLYLSTTSSSVGPSGEKPFSRLISTRSLQITMAVTERFSPKAGVSRRCT
jgi:hypothetical protein